MSVEVMRGGRRGPRGQEDTEKPEVSGEKRTIEGAAQRGLCLSVQHLL